MPTEEKNSKGKNNKVTGAFGEEVVARFLTQSGYEIIEKNWRVREGEDWLSAEKGYARESGNLLFHLSV